MYFRGERVYVLDIGSGYVTDIVEDGWVEVRLDSSGEREEFLPEDLKPACPYCGEAMHYGECTDCEHSANPGCRCPSCKKLEG